MTTQTDPPVHSPTRSSSRPLFRSSNEILHKKVETLEETNQAQEKTIKSYEDTCQTLHKEVEGLNTRLDWVEFRMMLPDFVKNNRRNTDRTDQEEWLVDPEEITVVLGKKVKRTSLQQMAEEFRQLHLHCPEKLIEKRTSPPV